MADQFDKKTFLDKFRTKAKAKNFNLDVDRRKLPSRTPTAIDFFDVVAETLSEILSKDQDRVGTLKAKSFKIGPSGVQKEVAYKDATVKADITTDRRFFTWLETFHTMLKTPYPEPGWGAPNIFATALKILLTQKPNSITAKITSGSDKVKVTI